MKYNREIVLMIFEKVYKLTEKVQTLQIDNDYDLMIAFNTLKKIVKNKEKI